jgi:hypothetical protein
MTDFFAVVIVVVGWALFFPGGLRYKKCAPRRVG